MPKTTRSEFVKCCLLGACACAVPAAAADEKPPATANPEAERLSGQMDAVRIRYAKLVTILDTTLDQTGKEKAFDQLGRECGRQFRSITWDKYRGNLKGFLEFALGPQGWMAKADYNESAGTLRVVDRSSHCTCPLVKEGLTSATQCLCTLGWQRETYSQILGKPVQAELEESILRGGTKCVFRIRVV
jgi:predicted hydrocarbon binding protein